MDCFQRRSFSPYFFSAIQIHPPRFGLERFTSLQCSSIEVARFLGSPRWFSNNHFNITSFELKGSSFTHLSKTASALKIKSQTHRFGDLAVLIITTEKLIC
jgi:hypothetical protein